METTTTRCPSVADWLVVEATVRSVVRRHVRSQDCDDVVHSCVLKVIPHLRDVGDVVHYARRAARNLCIEQRLQRNRAPRADPFDTEPVASGGADASAPMSAVESVVTDLRPALRRRRRCDDRRIRDLAVLLGVQDRELRAAAASGGALRALLAKLDTQGNLP